MDEFGNGYFVGQAVLQARPFDYIAICQRLLELNIEGEDGAFFRGFVYPAVEELHKRFKQEKEKGVNNGR